MEIVTEIATEAMVAGGAWTMLGTVGVDAIGSEGPFADGHFDGVRAKACAMGGDAVAVMASRWADNVPAASDASLAYVVLRKPARTSTAGAQHAARTR